MNDRGDVLVHHQVGQDRTCVVRGDVETNQGCIPNPGGVRGGQVVDDDDAITALAQEADDMGANVAGATTNENTHGLRIRRVGSSLLPASGLWYRSERA